MTLENIEGLVSRNGSSHTDSSAAAGPKMLQDSPNVLAKTVVGRYRADGLGTKGELRWRCMRWLCSTTTFVFITA